MKPAETARRRQAWITAQLLKRRAIHNREPVDKDKPGPDAPLCSCVQDRFADLLPELRPKPVQSMRGLWKVTGPGCGLVYWTNRKNDLCPECEKKGIRVPSDHERQ